MSSINLDKGRSINLSKENTLSSKLMVGVGWDYVDQAVDLDVSVFMLNKYNKLPLDQYFIFYNNLKSPDGAIQHSGDNRTGAGDGDDEMILVNLLQIHQEINEMIFMVSIYESDKKNHHFGLIKNAYIRLYDLENKKEICRFNLDSEYGATDLEFIKINKDNNNNWHFTALGNFNKLGLQHYVNKYV